MEARILLEGEIPGGRQQFRGFGGTNLFQGFTYNIDIESMDRGNLNGV
jgi:hypothetical protein